jgi:hypothetical protein
VGHEGDDAAAAGKACPVAPAPQEAEPLTDMIAMPGHCAGRSAGRGGRAWSRRGCADLTADAVVRRYLRMSRAPGFPRNAPSRDGDGDALYLFQWERVLRPKPGHSSAAPADRGDAAGQEPNTLLQENLPSCPLESPRGCRRKPRATNPVDDRASSGLTLATGWRCGRQCGLSLRHCWLRGWRFLPPRLRP